MRTELSEWHKELALELHGMGARVEGIARYIGRAESTVVAFLKDHTAFQPEPMQRLGSKGILHKQYREGFAAGYRLALAHVKLHGEGSAHEHWWHGLMPWVREGLDDRAPALLRIHRGH